MEKKMRALKSVTPVTRKEHAIEAMAESRGERRGMQRERRRLKRILRRVQVAFVAGRGQYDNTCSASFGIGQAIFEAFDEPRLRRPVPTG